MKRVIVILTAVASVIAVSGQTRMSVEECMRYAVEHNHGVRQRELMLDNHKADKLAVLGSFMPSVGINVGAQYNFGRAIDPETNTYTNVNTFNNGEELYASLPIFDGLRRVHMLQAEKASILMGKNALETEKKKTELAVFQSYVDVLYYKGTVEMTKAKREESEMMMKRTRLMEEIGQKSMADVAQMEAQLAGDECEMVRQENMLRVAMIRLKSEMNYEGELEIEDEIVEVGTREKDEATGSNSELEEAYHEMEASRRSYAAAKAEFMPQLSVNAGINTSYYRTMGESAPSLGRQLKDNKGEYVGASLNIPIFSRLSNVANVKKAKNNYKIARERYEAKQVELNQLRMQAEADAEGYERQAVQMEKKVAADSIAYEMVRRQYEEGLASPIEVQQSAAVLLQSRATHLQSRLMLAVKNRVWRMYN
ncbi:MAG: TolC family protein [Bacteroidales bacterium]|nr:TolC family protein [Bacteroidales bacterium]